VRHTGSPCRGVRHFSRLYIAVPPLPHTCALSGRRTNVCAQDKASLRRDVTLPLISTAAITGGVSKLALSLSLSARGRWHIALSGLSRIRQRLLCCPLTRCRTPRDRPTCCSVLVHYFQVNLGAERQIRQLLIWREWHYLGHLLGDTFDVKKTTCGLTWGKCH
jgi:hypothetical protein